MVRIIWEEYQRIKDLKELDLEACEFGCVNILNLGWKAWGKWFCGKCEKEYVLCPELCLKASENILGCELVRKRQVKVIEAVKPNLTYDKCACYGCGKELRAASKKGKVKNRNNPRF